MPERRNIKTIIASSSRMNATSVASTATERHTAGETKTKTETTIRLKEITSSTGNAKTVIKEVTGLLIVGRRQENRNMMTSTTYLWEQHYVEKSKKRTIKKILNNG